MFSYLKKAALEEHHDTEGGKLQSFYVTMSAMSVRKKASPRLSLINQRLVSHLLSYLRFYIFEISFAEKETQVRRDLRWLDRDFAGSAKSRRIVES